MVEGAGYAVQLNVLWITPARIALCLFLPGYVDAVFVSWPSPAMRLSDPIESTMCSAWLHHSFTGCTWCNLSSLWSTQLVAPCDNGMVKLCCCLFVNVL
jgi:hypothetical protein